MKVGRHGDRLKRCFHSWHRKLPVLVLVLVLVGPVAGAAAPAARTPVQPSYLSSAQAFSDPSADADLSMPRPDDAAQNLYQRRREMARRRMTVVAILLVVSILLIVGLCVVVFWR